MGYRNHLKKISKVEYEKIKDLKMEELLARVTNKEAKEYLASDFFNQPKELLAFLLWKNNSEAVENSTKMKALIKKSQKTHDEIYAYDGADEEHMRKLVLTSKSISNEMKVIFKKGKALEKKIRQLIELEKTKEK